MLLFSICVVLTYRNSLLLFSSRSCENHPCTYILSKYCTVVSVLLQVGGAVASKASEIQNLHILSGNSFHGNGISLASHLD